MPCPSVSFFCNQPPTSRSIMKHPTPQITCKPFLTRISSAVALVAALAVLAGVSMAQAGVFVKANNVDALNLATSWTNSAVPGASDIAQWDATVSDPNNTTNTLGASATWGGISIVNPAAPIVIANDSSVLTLGLGGINMLGASQDLTMSNAVVLPDYTLQTWSVPAGRTLSLQGAFTRTGGAALTFNDNGTINIAGGTASSMLGYGLINGTDVAALDGSKNVSTVALVIGYTSVSALNVASLAQYIDFDGSSIATGTTDDLNMNTKIGYPRVYHFNAPQPSGRGFWQLNAYKGQFELNSGVNTVLVTTNVGACDVIFHTSSSGITMGWRQSSGCELVLDQEDTAGSIYFQNGLSQKNALAGNILTKRGAGRAVFNTALVHSGPTRILEGELMINSTTVPTSVFTISSGGTLSGIGDVSGLVTNLGGGTIWSGTNGLGVLTLSGGLTLNAGSGLNFYGASVSATNTAAPLNLTGNLTVAGAVKVSILADHAAIGQYPLIHWTNGVAAPTFANFSLVQMPLRTQGYLSNNVANSSIDLVVTNVNEPIRWATGDGTWDLATTPNWVDSLGAATTYQQLNNGVGDSVLFEDAASGASPLSVTCNSTLSPATVTVNASKNYTFSGSGTIAGPATFTKSGTGTLTLQTANSFSGGLNINGGVLRFSALTNLGAGPINFGGGTLQYNGNSDDISVRAITFNPGGGTIDTAGQAVTFANPIGSGAGGGLTKAGAGTLTLTGTNQYVGNTVVAGGTLALAASSYISNSAAIIVQSGAVLDTASSGVNLLLNPAAGQMLAGVGTVNGSVTAPAGTTISPATNGVYGTLSLASDLTINGGALVMDISNTQKDFISVGGNLTISSGSLLVLTNPTPLATGVYKLIQYGGSLVSGAGSSGNLTITGLSLAGKSATLSDATGGEIDLIVADSASDNLVWSGAGANWGLDGSLNWFIGGTTPWAYTNGDAVTFNDSATGNSSVQLQAAVLPSSVTVNNASVTPYIFADGTGTGAGKIGGTTALVKDGSGTLILQTANTYSGPTTIKNGTLQVGSGGIGDLGTGNVTNNGALVFAQGDGNTHTIAAPITGTGSLTQQGSSSVVLAADNKYTGSTTISSGVLQLGAGSAAGSIVTPIITNNATLVLNHSGADTFTNGVIGSGALSKQGSATTTLAASLSYQGNTSISNGVIKLSANEQIPDANSVAGSTGWLILDGGNAAAGTFDLAGFNETINSLSGLAGTVNGVITNSGTAAATTNRLTILENAGTTYNGLIADNTNGSKIAVTLLGNSVLRLNGANNYAGGTILGGTATLGVGPGATFGAGGILMSNGTAFYMYNNGSAGSYPGDNITIVSGATATINSSSLGNGFGGNVFGGANCTNVILGPVSAGASSVEQWSNFLGTVQIPNGGTLRFSSTSLSLNGGEQATFEVDGTGVLQTRNAGTVRLGALSGNGNISNPQANTGTGVFQIGFNNANSTFSGSITGTNSIIKVGMGTLALSGGATTNISTPDGFTFYTNVFYTNLLTYVGTTTISNGVLKVVVPDTLTNGPTAITLSAPTAVLDASDMGYISNYSDATVTNQTLIKNGVFEVVSGQTLSGLGTIRSSKVLLDAGSTLNVGLPTGVLTATNNVELAGAVTVNLSRTNTPNSGELAAQTFTIDGTATLVVTNIGSALVNGDKFTLFNKGVTFVNPILPATDPTGTTNYVWQNNLATDGTITLVSGGISPINSNPPPILTSLSGNILSLSWPTNSGWTLQMQTNNLSTGLGTNWVDLPGSTSITSTNITIDPTAPTVFFRLKL